VSAEDERLRGLAEACAVAVPQGCEPFDPKCELCRESRDAILAALRAAIEPVKRQRDEAAELLRNLLNANHGGHLRVVEHYGTKVCNSSCAVCAANLGLLATIAAGEAGEDDRG